MGGKVEQPEFIRAYRRAVAEVDRRTFGRFRNVETAPEALKACMVELIDLAATNSAYTAADGSGAVTSRSNDGVSESYAVASASDWATRIYPEKAAAIIETYLSETYTDDGVSVIYRGVTL